MHDQFFPFFQYFFLSYFFSFFQCCHGDINSRLLPLMHNWMHIECWRGAVKIPLVKVEHQSCCRRLQSTHNQMKCLTWKQGWRDRELVWTGKIQQKEVFISSSYSQINSVSVFWHSKTQLFQEVSWELCKLFHALSCNFLSLRLAAFRLR